MPFYSKTEFSKLCGFQKSNELSVYISRGKVVMSGDFVDTNIPENISFLERRRAILAAKGQEIPLEKIEQPSPVAAPIVLRKVSQKKVVEGPKGIEKPAKKEAPKPPAISAPTLPEGFTATTQMAMQKDQLDIEKKVVEIKLKKLEHQKKLGELVPTDLVRSLFVQHSKSIMSAFHDEADNFLMEISKEAGLTREQLAKMRGRLVLKINQGVENALKESKKALQAIVEEYKSLRGVGEHD